MITIHVTPEMLGDVATTEDAQRMAELLRAKGYDVELAEGRNEFDAEDDEEQFAADWDSAMETIGAEWVAGEAAKA